MIDRRPDDLPSVEIVAVPFHRFRRRKWALTFVPAGGGAPVRRTLPTFEQAVAAARELALAERSALAA